MKNSLIIIFQILNISFVIIYSQDSQSEYELWENNQILEQKKEEHKTLEFYLKKFEQDKSNKKVFKKIKELLIEKKKFKLLIDLYEPYINNISKINNKFEAEIELLEIKIWSNQNKWIDDLYVLEDKYQNDQKNQNQNEYILHKLLKNKKIDEAYDFVRYIRKKYHLPHFFSKKMIGIFKENKGYKHSINESIIYLTQDPNSHNQSFIAKKIIIEQIFELLEKILLESLSNNVYLPITDKQFSSNAFLNFESPMIENHENIEYIIQTYNTLINSSLNIEESKIKLAEIQYKLFNDLDNAYKMYDELEQESSKISIDIKAILGKADVLISKGYLDSALRLLENQNALIKRYNNPSLTNNMNYKKTQIFLFKGDYNQMNLSLDSLIKSFELKNDNFNDLLEVKMLSLFFTEDLNEFKKYSSIQHKIKMNKKFEATLELIQLMSVDNILISELSQFQYALIELQKGNIDNAQQMILEMNKNTVFYEIALVLNAEIEDHLNKDYKKAIQLYENFIIQYPNSIYRELILKRLNKINNSLDEDLDL